MKQYNITAQVYSKFDNARQTILMNEVVSAKSTDNAVDSFKEIFEVDYHIVKIYSIEEISQVVA